jgi:serine/threonine protein kinase
LGSRLSSREETDTLALTNEHTILGTWQYMSPEQLQAKEAGPRSDIFSFGVIAAVLERPGPSLTGWLPRR